MTTKDYSFKLGKCRSTLSTYRHIRGLSKDMKPHELYEVYLDELNSENEVNLKLQSIFFELQEKEQFSKFGEYCVSIGLCNRKSDIYGRLSRTFNVTTKVIGRKYITNRKMIVKAYEEWVNDNS